MLPSVIGKIDDADEGDRQHYVYCTDAGPNNGKYVLQLDGKHPVQTKNTQLLTTISKHGEEKTRLEAKQIPDGKIAADPTTVEMGEAAIAEGFKSKKDLTDIKTRATTAEQKLASEETAKINIRIAGAAGKNPEAWAEHVSAKGLKFEETTVKDDKDNDVTATTVVHKNDAGAEVKTPLKEYTEKHAAYVAAAVPQKRRTNFNLPKEETPEGDVTEFDEIEKEMNERNKATQTAHLSFADQFFGRTTSGGQQ